METKVTLTSCILNLIRVTTLSRTINCKLETLTLLNLRVDSTIKVSKCET